MPAGRIDAWVTLLDESIDAESHEVELEHLLRDVAQLDDLVIDRTLPGLPTGARAGSGMQVGAALIALGGSGATVPVLVGLLRDWLGRRGAGSIRLKIGEDEIEIDRAPTALQREALTEFLNRHRD